jgi:hypothetical protein
MKYFGLFSIILAMTLGLSGLWSASATAAPNARYGILLNAGYSEFEPDSASLTARVDSDYGYRIGVFYDPDGESDRGFEFDVSFFNFGEYEYCLKDISSAPLQAASMNSQSTSRLGEVCSEFEAEGYAVGGTYVIPLSRLSRKRSVLDKFSGFIGAGYSDMDFNPSPNASVIPTDNDEGFYVETGLLWTGGFGKRKRFENFGIRASYRLHDNNGISYWSVGLVWDL